MSWEQPVLVGKVELKTKTLERISALESKLAELEAVMEQPERQRKPPYVAGGDMALARMIQTLERTELPLVFADEKLECLPLVFHKLQESHHSCQVATLVNVLDSLGVSPGMKESEIYKATGANPAGTLWPNEGTDFLVSKGLAVSELKNVLEIIKAIIGGAKIILNVINVYRGTSHCVLISGLKIENGKIVFYVNDPAYDSCNQDMPLDNLVEIVNPGTWYKLMRPRAVARKK